MSQQSFNFDEFIQKKGDAAEESSIETADIAEVQMEAEANELDVHKVVVEELAAEKAELREKMAGQEADMLALKTKYENVARELEVKKAEVFSLKSETEALKGMVNSLEAKLSAQMVKDVDMQERNPNALALIDRDVDLPDRFPGETRDHVLEVIRDARDRAETEGRLRRAQVLEGVLLVNEPNGTLGQRREALEKLFAKNNNLITGEVLEELNCLGISHKNGEEYLLPSEILKRTY
ncbi:MAG: hypothetical protein ACI4R9_01695 [Kiritimatiellia bacterium]